MKPNCIFCQIVDGRLPAAIVWEGEHALAFLDTRPLFPGHCLLIPKRHWETLLDLPEAQAGPLLVAAQKLARAMESGLGAEGSFVAVNNRISQSVPHLHVHVVPRRKKDGLKGFFWPRSKYASEEQMGEVAEALRRALGEMNEAP